jgi:hypothetical protein
VLTVSAAGVVFRYLPRDLRAGTKEVEADEAISLALVE